MSKTLVNINMTFCSNKNDKVNNGYMKITEINPSSSMLIDLVLRTDMFTTFYCTEKKTVVGINLLIFNKVLECISENDLSLTMCVDDNDIKNLKIIVNNETGITNTFSLELLNLKNTMLLQVPQSEINAKITMSCDEFHKLCKEIYKLNDSVELECSKDKLIMKCGNVVINTITECSGAKIEGQFQESNFDYSIKGKFNLSDLVSFDELASLSELLPFEDTNVQIFMKNDLPLIIKYNIANLGRLLIFLTPLETADDKIDKDIWNKEIFDERSIEEISDIER